MKKTLTKGYKQPAYFDLLKEFPELNPEHVQKQKMINRTIGFLCGLFVSGIIVAIINLIA